MKRYTQRACIIACIAVLLSIIQTVHQTIKQSINPIESINQPIIPPPWGTSHFLCDFSNSVNRHFCLHLVELLVQDQRKQSKSPSNDQSNNQSNNRSNVTPACSLLLIHGTAGHTGSWKGFVQEFIKQSTNQSNNQPCNIYALDLRGHGLSGGERGDWLIDELIDDVKHAAEFIQHNQLRSIYQSINQTASRIRPFVPVILLGSSQGGEVVYQSINQLPSSLIGGSISMNIIAANIQPINRSIKWLRLFDQTLRKISSSVMSIWRSLSHVINKVINQSIKHPKHHVQETSYGLSDLIGWFTVPTRLVMNWDEIYMDQSTNPINQSISPSIDQSANAGARLYQEKVHDPLQAWGIKVKSYLSLFQPELIDQSIDRIMEQPDHQPVCPTHSSHSSNPSINQSNKRSITQSINPPTNPYRGLNGKHMLIVCGERDKIFPWRHCEYVSQVLRSNNQSNNQSNNVSAYLWLGGVHQLIAFNQTNFVSLVQSFLRTTIPVMRARWQSSNQSINQSNQYVAPFYWPAPFGMDQSVRSETIMPLDLIF